MIHLPGNEALQARVKSLLRHRRLPQSLLISGPDGSGKHELARYLAAALMCQHPIDGQPCGGCPECRRVENGIHPDLISIDSDKTMIPVDTIRAAYADAMILPNQAPCKVYLLPAERLSDQDQNALLKLIEEPPTYGAFFLLSANPAQLLETIRSRVVELRLAPVAAPAQELLPETSALCKALCSPQRAAAVLRVCVPMEKYKREQLAPILRQTLETLTAALAVRAGRSGDPTAAALANAVSARSLMAACTLMQEALLHLESNVSAGHLCGALAAKLGELP